MIATILFIFGLSLTVISCSSEDDAALKDGKLASDISEADLLEAPYISSLTINNLSATTNQTAVSVKLTGKDAVGITGYIISNQSTTPELPSSDWVSVTSQTQYSVSKDSTVGPSDASYSFYGWMRDGANNISATATSSIFYDTTAPTLSSVSINSGDSTTTNTLVSLTISASDSLSGITAYYASETSTDPSVTPTSWVDINTTNSLSTTLNFTLSSPGAEGSFSKTVYLWLKDAAGNVSSNSSDSITLIVADTTAPTSPYISINSGSSSTTSSSVTLSLSVSDNVGVTGYYLSTNSSTPSSTASGWTSVTSTTSYSASVNYTFNTTGTITLYVWFKDEAGNVSASTSDNINLIIPDTTPPTLAEVYSVITPTSDSTPEYTFSSDEAGTITYGGSCSSNTTAAVFGNNNITLNSLQEGTFLNCQIIVTDTAGNKSLPLNMTSFTVSSVEFLAVGESGTIIVSHDGTTWTSRTSGITDTLQGVTYGNGTFVVVGNSGTLLTSSDNGTTWTSRTSGTAYSINQVTYGNGTFVGVGDWGTYLTSSDNGNTWTSGTSHVEETDLHDVTYANSIFVVVGEHGDILTSSDNGNTWTLKGIQVSGQNAGVNLLTTIYAIGYGNSTFVAVGNLSRLITSSNGTTWYYRGGGNSLGLQGVTYGNGLFVTVGGSGTITTSTDGYNWTGLGSGESEDFRGVTYGNGLFVTVGDSGTITTSTDGTNWTTRTSGTTSSIFGVTSK